MERTSIMLIGMPSSGKSTTGKALAKILDKKFIDTDMLLKEKCLMPLGDYVGKKGREAFLQLQQKTIMDYDFYDCVVATGGSVVCSDKSMKHLHNFGKVIYLNLELRELENRINKKRALARDKGQSIKDVYVERKPMYEKYADITINCSGKTTEKILKEIMNNLFDENIASAGDK